jgi:hypothetical protein
MSDIKKTVEAYLSMVSEKKHTKEAKEECPKCEGEGCDHCDGKGYHEVEEATKKEKKELDPVNDKENDKPFAKRKDKDIDNDGDVDGSDEYLHKKRAATDDAIDGGDKPADNADDKKKKDKNPRTSDKTAEISKIESVTTKEAFDVLWKAIEEAIDQKKGATPPEGMDDKESPKGKEFKAAHKVDVKSHDELEKIEEPKERKVKKEMNEYEVIRQILSGKPVGE